MITNFSKKGKYGLGTGAVGARAIANDMIELISSKTGEDDNSD